MLAKNKLVFLLDVDNTLLDNDRFATDLTERLTKSFGVNECDRFWVIYSKLRDQLGYADYLGALEAFSSGLADRPELRQMSPFLLDYPFENRLYPRVLEVISHLQTLGLPTILSDGDTIFQPRKVQRSGLGLAVAGQVMIFVHKELEAASIQRRYPAEHYVIVDDKPQLLAAMKQVFSARLTTIFVTQGHYAIESLNAEIDPPPDRRIKTIAELMEFSLSDFLVAAPQAVTHDPMERDSKEHV